MKTPEAGWKHATNAADFGIGGRGVFHWWEGGKLWNGKVQEVDVLRLRVKVVDVMLSVFAPLYPPEPDAREEGTK